MSIPEIEEELARTRAELNDTLSAIGDKFDIPKQTKLAGSRIAASYRKNPLPWIAGAAGTVLVAGLLIVLGSRRG